MTTYRELTPLPGLGLDCVWTQPARTSRLQRVLPDGCIDIIWSRSNGTLQVAGPDTEPRIVRVSEGDDMVAVRFLPGRAPAVLGIPADALRDTMIPLADLWGTAAEELAAALSAPSVSRAPSVAAGPPTIFYDSDPFEEPTRPLPEAAILQRAVATRTTPPDRYVIATANALAAPGTVASTADGLGLSERQLRRRCLAAFGYGPKTLQRILRFQRALALARSGSPLADTAIEAGYADQAHLANEVRRLAGVPLTELT